MPDVTTRRYGTRTITSKTNSTSSSGLEINDSMLLSSNRYASTSPNRGNRVLPTSYWMTAEDITYMVGSFIQHEYTNKKWYSTYTCSGPGVQGGPLFPYIDWSSMVRESRNRCLDKIYAGFSDVNLSVDLAEVSSTAKMVNLKDNISSLARMAKRSGFPGVKTIGSAWLQFQYGWKPLLSTIWDLTGSNLYSSVSEPVVLKARSGVTRKEVATAPWTIGSSQASVRHEIGLAYRVDSPHLNALSKVTTLDPRVLAWELLPFSFVADWFYDVGGYLALAEASLGIGKSFLYGYETESWQEIHKTSINQSTRTGDELNFTLTNHSASYSFKKRGMTRTVLTSFPKPSMPVFKADLGSSRMLSAAALLSTLLK